MFREPYKRHESLFKSHEKTIFSVINTNKKITTQQPDKVNEKFRRKYQYNRETGKAKLWLSESLNTDKVEQNESKIEKLQGQLKSVNRDIVCKHKESLNLIRT